MSDELPAEGYFNVACHDVDRAVEHATARGFPPVRIEPRDDGTADLVFAVLRDDQMYAFTQALPVHLSTGVAIMTGPDETEH